MRYFHRYWCQNWFLDSTAPSVSRNQQHRCHMWYTGKLVSGLQQGRDGDMWASGLCENITETAAPRSQGRSTLFSVRTPGDYMIRPKPGIWTYLWYERNVWLDLPSQGSQTGTSIWCYYQPLYKDRGTGFLKESGYFCDQYHDGYPPTLRTRQLHFCGFMCRWEVKWPHVRRWKLYTKPHDSKCTLENMGPRLCRVLLNEFLQCKLE